ncbi:MAG: sugar phosphate isomerase/epimerase family protein [Pleomorphochaeta sp.]
MKIGFMTNVLVKNGLTDIKDIAYFAKQNGFEDLEVGPTIALDQERFENVINYGVNINSLTYCRNYLSSNVDEANLHIKGLMDRIEFASKLGISQITTSTGINKQISEGVYDSVDSIRLRPEKSLDEFYELFAPIVEKAEKKNVKIAFENCPLMGNIAISPYMWRKIFERLNSNMVGLTYDPSHLIWEHIDPIKPLYEFKDKIFQIHAKDTIVNHEVLSDLGFLTDFSWWRYCIPGDGDLDWTTFFKAVHDIEFDRTISIEHEDMRYEGSIEKVEDGLIKSREYLLKIINKEFI